jgi:muconolactone delta-isomerase
MWALPGDLRALGLWQVRDQAQLPAILASLPLSGWMTVDTTPLDQHPNDPALRPPSA